MLTRVIEYGSEFDWDSNKPFETDEATDSILGAIQLLRGGRDALKVVAQDNSSCYKNVLMPALSCSSMVSPFVDKGYKATFYALRPDYSADISDIEAKLTNQTILVCMNYFGIQAILDEDLQRLRREYPSAIFVEDRTHDVLSERITAFTPDYTIASIRKWLAVPDGGLLWTNRDIHTDCSTMDEKYTTIRTSALKRKSAYLKTGDRNIKKEYRLLQAEAVESVNTDKAIRGMSDDSKQILKRIDYQKLISVRRENVNALKTCLQPLADAGRLEFITDAPEKSTLYFPILLSNEDVRDTVQRLAVSYDLYCPVIWPIPRGAEGVSLVAERTANCMLGIPCDQRYSTDDMRMVANTLEKCLS